MELKTIADLLDLAESARTDCSKRAALNTAEQLLADTESAARGSDCWRDWQALSARCANLRDGAKV